MKSSFFLHEPIEPSNASNFRDFLKPDDEKRIEIMNLVKEGLPLEEALSKAQEMGIAVNNTSFQLKSNEVYNFGIYKYQSNNKCTKCILQLDFQENVLCLIKRGIKQKSYQFDSIEYIDTVDNLTRIVIHFENGAYIDIEPGSLEEKSRISRLLLFILNQDQQEPPRLNSLVAKREKIILEGLLEKRARKAPFTTWTKRFVKILPGEVMYFKVGDQENESSALSIIPLKLGDAVLKNNDGEFTLLLNDKEYSFRIIPSKNSNSNDRDNWVEAIENAIKTSSLHKNESFSYVHDQRQIFSNAFKSIKAQLKQFESILHSIEAPYEAWEQLKKIQKTVSFLREKIKQKSFFDEKIIVNNYDNKENIKKIEIDSPCSTSNLNFNKAVDQSLNLQTGLLSNIPPIQMMSVSNAPILNIPTAPEFSIPTPPLLSGLSSKLPAKPTVVPTCKMKPLFWTKTNDAEVLKSFWLNSQDKTHLLNVKKLENLFHHVGQEIAKKEQKKVSELDCKNSQNTTLLDQRKAQNLGIFLSGFKINETNIEKKLMMFNTSEGLTNEEIVALKKFYPTADEIEMYKNYQGDSKKLTDIDKFMIKLCNIPNLAIQLNLLLTMHDLPDEIKNIKMLLKHLRNACLCLLENNNFTRLLEYILVLGNYMNGGTPRGAAYGFKLSVLIKLVDIKSYDKKHTLIDFIVEELWEVDKEAICCYKDMQPLTNPIDFSLKNLLVEFQIMQKELLFFKEKQKGIEADLGEKIYKNINEFYETYSKKFLKVQLMCQKIEEMCALLKKKFGEQSSLHIEAWLSEIGGFVKHLQTAVEIAERKHSKDCSSISTKISDSNKANKTSYTKNQNNENSETCVHTKIEPFKSHALNLSNTPDKFIENIAPVKNIEPIRGQSKNADENKNTQCVISELKNALLQNETKSNILDVTIKPQSLQQNSEKIEQLKEMSGFLEKLSGGKKRTAKWDQRYFELKENGYLQYFKKKGGAIKGSVDLNGCPISLDPDNNCIIIVLQNNRQWKFKGLPLEEALRRAQEMGVALNNQNFSAKSNEVYNFSIYKYQSNNKCSKYILQLNFQENILCLIKRGVRQRSYQLDSIKNIDTSDDSTRIIVQFENGSYIEIESKSLEEKNQLSHLFFSILNQDQHYLPILNSIVAKRESIILEGVLEKKGRNAAFLKWTKRYVKVLPGEIMYFKVGDQENESTALNIISLTVGDVILKRNFDSGFTLLVKEKDYTFRIIPFKNNNVELERDSWLMAIEHALNTTSNKKEEDFIDGIDQKQLYINAVNSITLQVKQFESVLYSMAPFQAFEHLKKIQDTVFLFSEQIKSKLFSNLGIYKESNNQIEKTGNSFFKLKNTGKPLNNFDLPSTLPTTDPSYDETLSAVLLPSKDPSSNIPTTPPSNLMPIPEFNNNKNLNIPLAPPFIPNSLINAPNALNLSNLVVTPFTVPVAPFFGLSPKLPVKSNEAPTCKIKPLFWNKLPDSQIMNSFWINSQDKSHLLNVKKLEDLFHQVSQESSKKEPSKLSDLDCNNSQNVTLLEQRKAQNLGIFLSGFKINETNIEEKLMMYNTSEGLTNEEIVALKRFHPTVDEIEMYKKYQGDSKKLTDIDKFMIKLCNIPNLGKRLDLLLTMSDLPDEIKNIKIPLKHLTNACLCLAENNQFTRMLEYILVLGNYMNGGTPRGAAYGFKLSVLTKLIDVKSYDKKHTLLDFIVEELWNIDKDAICCYKGMQALKTPIDFSLKNLMTEFQIMQKELLSLKEKSKGIEADLGEKLCKNINEFYMSYSAKLSKIEVLCKNVQNLYILLINKFGESSSLDVESWLGETGCFIKHLQTAVENAERKYKENNLHSLINHSTSLLIETKPFNTSSTGGQLKIVDQSENTQADLNNTINQNKDTNIYEQHSLKQYSEETEKSNEKYVLSGFLEKLSGGKKRAAKWDLRYFELTENGYLQYFKKKGGTLIGNIYLKGFPISLDPKNNCIINILQNDRDWKLRGDNDVVISKWLKLLLHYASKK